MTDLLWMRPGEDEDNPNYVRSFEADVRKARGDWVLLDRTAFYAGGGGQPPDRGTLSWDGGEAQVVDVDRRGVVKHVLDGPVPEEGTRVEGRLDWDRRYAIMRAHTAQHVASAVVHELHGVGTLRAEMEPGAATFELDGAVAPEEAREALEVVRDLADDGRPVSVREMRREAVEEQVPEGRADLSRVPGRSRLRVVEVESLDLCPCGGTHVASTDELAPVEVLGVVDGSDGGELRLELGPA